MRGLRRDGSSRGCARLEKARAFDLLSLAESAPEGHRSFVHPQQIAIYKAMSPADKLRLAAGFNASARNLKRAALKQFHPDWTEEQVEKKLRDLFLHASA